MGIGVEIEVENCPEQGFPTPAGWQIKRDDSLRNNGYEFVTRFGARLADVGKLLYNLNNMMVSGRSVHGNDGLFDFNERTSVHVHVDIRKFMPRDVKSLLLLYTLFEDSLFKLAGEHRKHGVFSVPIRYQAMSEIMRGNVYDTIMTWQKYCAINFTRLPDIGTVEFRHMEGTSNYERLHKWVLILCKLVDFARTISVNQLQDEISKLKYQSHYTEFTNKVFGPLAKYIDVVPQEFDMAVSDAKLFFNLRAD